MPLDPTHDTDQPDDLPWLRTLGSLILCAAFLAGLAVGRWLG